MQPFLTPTIFFLVVLGIFYLWISSRNKERMALIEKGESADKFFGTPSKAQNLWLLNLGTFAIGIALGVLAGYLLNTYTDMRGKQSYPAAIFFFGGVSLVVAYLISRNINGKK